MMQSISRFWLWSPILVFIYRTGASCATPFISRSNEVVADPLAELRPSSCAQQLEKLKMETRRHVNALNAIDYSLNTPRRSRKLLSTIQTLELGPLPNLRRALSDIRQIPESDAPRTNQKLQARLPSPNPTIPNSLTTYLSGSEHTRWVSECLKGGKCADSASEPSGNPKTGHLTELNSMEIMSNENSANTAEIANETSSANANKMIPDPININITNADPVIELLPSTSDAGLGSTSEPEVGNTVNGKNRTLENRLEDTGETTTNLESMKGSGPPLAVGENTGTENNSSNAFEAKPPLFSQVGIFSEPIKNREFSASEDQSTMSAKSLRLAPEDGNRLVHYNPVFLPVKIQFIPRPYPDRFPLMSTYRDVSGAFDASGAGESALHPTLLQSYKFNGFDSLDSLTANYGNDLVKRGSTGKRESTFFPKKEAVTTTYPELPGYQPVDEGRIFVNQGRRENATDADGPIYFFLGGNWVANFKDHPQLFYVQPQQSMTESSTNPDFSKTPGCSGANVTLPPDLQPYLRPYAIGEQIMERPFPPAGCNYRSSNMKLPDASKNVDPSPDFQSYRHTYGVNQQIMERPVPPAGYNGRSSNTRLRDASQNVDPSSDLQPYIQPYAISEQIMGRPVPAAEYNTRLPMRFPVASRNSYTWYDYTPVTNDVNQRPMNGPFSGGPVSFPSADPSDRGIRKGVFRQTNDLNYEDSLVNLALPNGPVEGSYDTSKPEDFLEHDINTPDMFFVGTQLLASLPLQPTERHEDNSSDPAYGELIADVSSRSSPKLATGNGGTTDTRVLNSARTGPVRYLPSSWPNEFEFVSGQYLKRRPFTGTATQGLIYDQMGERQIRNVVGCPKINPLNDIQQPAHPFKSTCYGRTKRSVIPLHNFRK